MELFIAFGAVCAAGAGLIALSVVVSKREARQKAALAANADEHRAHLERKGHAELDLGNLEAARTLFIQARRPGKAAQVAVREGKLALAGALFERDGRLDKALVAYRRAGVDKKVAELEQRLAELRSGASAAPPVKGQPASLEQRAGDDATSHENMAELASPPVGDDALSAEARVTEQRDADDDALLHEDDGLLDLPELAPVAPQEAAPAQGTALAVMSLIKRKKPRAVVVEESVAAVRRSDDR